jgi:hypothetical protein
VLVLVAGKYLPSCYTEDGFVHFSRRSCSSSSLVNSSCRPQTAPLSATCTLGATTRTSCLATAAAAATAVDAAADARPQETARIYATTGVHSNVWSALATVPLTSTAAPAATARRKVARAQQAPVWHDGSIVSIAQRTTKHASRTAHQLRSSSENNAVQCNSQRERPSTAHAKSGTVRSQQQQQQQQQQQHAKPQTLLTLSRRKRWGVCSSSDISADLTVTSTANGPRRVTLLSQHTASSSSGSNDAAPIAVRHRRPRTASARLISASEANIIVL